MIPLPLAPKLIRKENNKAIFDIEALYPGYGVTIGNALRRVLLSSLPGAAITQVKIKGAPHEFSTIPNVLEDTIQICLSLKQLRFKSFSDEPQKATLRVKGERTILAKDFELPSQVELINKDQKIATTTSKSAEFEMEIQIEKGLGYVTVEKKKKTNQPKPEIGVIYLDAIFSPVKRVSFKVENMRVGERTDFDKLNLEIETDSTTTPEEVFKQASEILLNHFSQIVESFKAEPVAKEKEKSAKTAEDPSSAGDTSVEDLKLSTRTVNSLLKNNIKTVAQIVKKGNKGLQEAEGLGEKAIKEITRKLKKLGIEL